KGLRRRRFSISTGIVMKKKIVLLAGDGIGPEVTRAATGILRETAQEFSHEFEFVELPLGGAAIDATGTPLPNETLDACRKAGAGHGVVLDAGDRTDCDVCVHASGESNGAAVLGGQGQCAHKFAALAANRDGHECGLSSGQT